MLKTLLTVMLSLALAAPVVAAELGEDGLHKASWMRETFKDLREDLDEANAEGRRLAVIFEQRGCIYCTRMHEEVFPEPEIAEALNNEFFVVQINLFGDVEVTDFDGETLSEKDMARKWGILFTPTMMFFPEQVADGVSADEAAVVTMPGAFGKWTTLNMMTWVLEHGYEGDETFQRYHARKFAEQGGEE